MKCPVCQHEYFEENAPDEIRCSYCNTVLVLDRRWFRRKHILLSSIWIISMLIMYFVEMKYGFIFAITSALLILLVDALTDKYRVKPFEKEF